MAGITLAQAESQLALWLAASEAVATSQSYSVSGRSLTRADAKEIRENIDYWQAKTVQLDAAASSGASARRGIRLIGGTPT